MAAEAQDFFHATLLLSDVSSAILLFIGTLFLIGALKIFIGKRLKGPAGMVGTGLLLHAALHEFGEFICRSGIHGGIPKTAFGSVHIIFFGSIGAIVFFLGCYMLDKRYSEYLKEG